MITAIYKTIFCNWDWNKNHKKSVHTVSACNPKKYTTFPVLFLGFRYRIHDRRWKPLSGAWNCQSNRRCASSWVTGFIHPLLNRLRDVIIIINIYDKRILFIVQWITCHNAFFFFHVVELKIYSHILCTCVHVHTENLKAIFVLLWINKNIRIPYIHIMNAVSMFSIEAFTI